MSSSAFHIAGSQQIYIFLNLHNLVLHCNYLYLNSAVFIFITNRLIYNSVHNALLFNLAR